MKTHITSHGFTLIEILIALVIYSIVAMLASSGLWMVLHSEQVLHQRSNSLSKLQSALSIMQRDSQQIINRPAIDNSGEALSPLILNIYPTTYLEFTRGGINTTYSLPYTQLSRVAYFVRQHQLIRQTWLVLDRAPTSKPQQQVLLNDVRSFSVNVLDSHKKWHVTWPMHGNYFLKAKAVQFKICFIHDGCIDSFNILPAEALL